MAETIIQINPGDLSLPEGWMDIKRKKVFVLGSKAELVDRTKFDEVTLLRGSDPLPGDEVKALEETSF